MKYLFFDVETTGLWRRDLEATDKNQPRIVQIAAQLTDKKEKVYGQLACIVQPDGWKIPKEASDILKLESDFDDYKFPKLEETYKHFLGGGYMNWHDALTDIIVCRIIYFHMKAKGIEMVKPRDMPKALIKNLDEKVFKEVKNLLELSDT